LPKDQAAAEDALTPQFDPLEQPIGDGVLKRTLLRGIAPLVQCRSNDDAIIRAADSKPTTTDDETLHAILSDSVQTIVLQHVER
jgi:hypothetical protein